MRRNRRALRRTVCAALVGAQILASTMLVQIAFVQPALAAVPCGYPGKDGSPPSLSAVVNTYYKPPIGMLSAGSTLVPLGTLDTTGGGASTPIAAGDLVLIYQSQDGTFNSSNASTYVSASNSITSASYGDGLTGSGYTTLGNAGLYEYVYVVSAGGGLAVIQGAGATGGLLNSYTENTSPTAGQDGRQSYQIVRVPQYLTTTLASNFRAAYWDGDTGGINVVDIATTLNLGSGTNIFATGDGFRGGGFSVNSGGGGTANSSANYVYPISGSGFNGSNAPDGTKGEGILGSPGYYFQWTNFTGLTAPGVPTGPTVPGTANTADGYYGGDMARGAPGNAGGGGTDADPKSNDQNTGGGGGGNGGSGGVGGFPWTPSESTAVAPPYSGFPSYPINSTQTAGPYGSQTTGPYFPDLGGRGGAALAPSIARIFFGGGGGAGANNNASNDATNPYAKYGSSGGPGGGIVLLRIAQTNGSGGGTAALYADGVTGLAPDNDGGGGGGAGGTIVVTTPSTVATALSGLTLHADGAKGTTAARTSGTTVKHGPGGGGGGGSIVSTQAVTYTVAAGAAGTTTTSATTYGATAGSAGAAATNALASQVPGVRSGAECYNPGAAIFTGPVDAGEAIYNGADETGDFQGNTALVNNNNDFTARGLVFPAGTQLLNGSAIVGSPSGNTFSGLSSNPISNVDSKLYYDASTSLGSHVITLAATPPAAPAGWTVRLCADNGTDTAPNCAASGTTSCINPTDSGWISIGGVAGATATAQYCMPAATKTAVTYWAVYSAPKTGIVAFTQYDANVVASDDQEPTALTNTTHHELYAGWIVLTKPTPVVVSNGCPPGVTYTPSLPVGGICPGGILQYTIDYRNIAVGAGPTATYGTEGLNPHAFPVSGAGTLVITDDGTASGSWAASSNGLYENLTAGLGATNTGCGSSANHCGDSVAGTTYTKVGGGALAAGATGFVATIGGATFQLFPINYTGQIGQGTVTFAIQIK